MGESEKKKAWMKANTVQATAKLNRNTDADILDYYDGKLSAADIKTALREYISNHPKQEENK